MELPTLRLKFRRRGKSRRRQLRLFREDGKVGHKIAAARDGRAMRKIRKLIARVLAERVLLSEVKIRVTTAGRPHWGSTADLMGQFVAPFLLQHFGLRKGSGKRTPRHNAEIGGSPTSDHLTTKLTTFARDFPTFDGEAAARALALAFGIEGWQANSFETHTVVVDGVTFTVQILWGSAIGHGDHIHVGISLVG